MDNWLWGRGKEKKVMVMRPPLKIIDRVGVRLILRCRWIRPPLSSCRRRIRFPLVARARSVPARSSRLELRLHPLHVPALSGQVEFTKEVLIGKPGFFRELDENGFGPMLLPSANGHIKIVRELLRVGYMPFEGHIGLLIGGEAPLACGININAINSSGFTPKDVLDLLLQNDNDSHDIHIYRLFQQVGAMKARELSTNRPCLFPNSNSNRNANSAIFVFMEPMEGANERGFRIIHRYPERADGGGGAYSHLHKRTMMPGEAVMASDPEIFAVFTVFNAIGFFASLAIISLLTSGFPLRACLRLAIISMAGTYVIAVIYGSDKDEGSICDGDFDGGFYSRRSGNHDSRNKQPMNVERIDGQRGLPMTKPIEINISNDKARWATICVLVNPVEVALDRDATFCMREDNYKVMRFCISFGSSSSAMADKVFGPEDLIGVVSLRSSPVGVVNDRSKRGHPRSVAGGVGEDMSL
ncbi:hypothetical protein F3Y22_tig00112471pilonHSYRG00099 [Hibiscus syriacus]|uniref:Uncharacterized protein n=1 Tax=Hibiscus syriacus TaxID=106335 RepID=A0A6A2WY65_HIBSY|nr:hypothetical protein F3Y22_tig00112471pilonHSYRG00099 [Hibiscus syriacus]